MSKKTLSTLLIALFFLPVLFFLLLNSAEAVQLGNPLGTSSPQVVIGRVINKVLGVVGALALLMFIYGGITWMIAMGNEQQIKRGKDVLMWSSVGLIVIFSSYAIVTFVFEALGV